jgi:Protein of unknown function (DUF2818)
MGSSLSTWLVIFAAFVAANLPFVSNRLFGVLRLGRSKSLSVRLGECLTGYFVVGLLALALEHQAGRVASQRWEFYAVTVALFLTLAFPGFVWRYLAPHRGGD